MLRLVPLLLLLACTPKATTPDVAADVVLATDGPFAGVTASAPLPFDPGVRTGTLDNGLRWFIETNEVPDDRVVLRLVVEVGSVQEDDDQQGLAHFVEHMAFNGSENFPGNSLITELEGLGSRFGPHINAHTSFDETVYKLQLPTDDPAIVDTGFRILGDWAGGLAFETEEIEKERGVVLEEWRQGLGAGRRIFDQLRPLTFKDSRYLDRLPIGTEESLTTFTPDAARRFYKDWYRPDLMSVIVVGDVDPDEMQKKIEATFGGLQNPAKARERVVYEIPPHDETLVKVATDPEVPMVNLGIMQKHDYLEDATHGGYLNSLRKQLFTAMVNARLAEVAQQPGTPYLGAGAGEQRMTPTEGVWAIGGGAPEDKALDALRSIWTEVVRIKRHGFTEPELERARKAVLRGYDSYLQEKEKTQSVTHAEELIRHVTTDEPVPGIEYEVQMAKAWVPRITVEEINAWAKDWMPEESRVITAVIPEKEGLTPPTEDQLVAVMKEVEASEIAPWGDSGELASPVPERPAPAKITARDDTYQESLGFSGITLENGVKVWFRETDFKNDEIIIHAFRRGGHRAVGDDDYIALALSKDVKLASGAGPLSAPDMFKWMAGRKFSGNFSLPDSWDQFSGSSSPEDLDDMLGLIHQAMVSPRFTAEGRDEILEQQRAALANRDSQPGVKLAREVSEALWPDTPRRRYWELEDVEAALSDVDRLETLFKSRFGDAKDFTFVFVGNLPDDFEDDVATWLGTLPATGEAKGPGEVPLERKAGPHEIVVKANTEPKASVRMSWYVPVDADSLDWEARNRTQAVDEVLSTLLREELREARSGVYGVGVSVSTEDEWPAPAVTTSISFTCDPERVDELSEAALEIVDKVRTKAVDQRYIDEMIAKRTRSREERLKSNAFWARAFMGALARDEDPNEILTYDERNESLTPQVVLEAAKTYLPSSEPDLVSKLLPAEEG